MKFLVSDNREKIDNMPRATVTIKSEKIGDQVELPVVVAFNGTTCFSLAHLVPLSTMGIPSWGIQLERDPETGIVLIDHQLPENPMDAVFTFHEEAVNPVEGNKNGNPNSLYHNFMDEEGNFDREAYYAAAEKYTHEQLNAIVSGEVTDEQFTNMLEDLMKDEDFFKELTEQFNIEDIEEQE